jgi:hypothetical protein
MFMMLPLEGRCNQGEEIADLDAAEVLESSISQRAKLQLLQCWWRGVIAPIIDGVSQKLSKQTEHWERYSRLPTGRETRWMCWEMLILTDVMPSTCLNDDEVNIIL